MSSVVSKRNTTIKGKQLYQKVDEIRSLLKQGKYEEIEQFFQKAIAEKTFTAGGGFYAQQVLDRVFGDDDIVPFDASWQTYLDRWVKKSPNSSIAYLVRSVFYRDYACQLRGDKFTYETPEKAQKQFAEKMVLRIKDIQKSLSIDSENPLTIVETLYAGNSSRMPKEVFEAYFQKAISLVPYMVEAYTAKAISRTN